MCLDDLIHLVVLPPYFTMSKKDKFCDFLFDFLHIKSGPSCSKLTTSLVNDSLKFTSSDTQMC